jgi:AcrR family transcriptional regulator
MPFVSTADPLPRPPWSSERARRRTLDRETIVDAALAVVDAEGLGALSMRRLAQALDTGAASLYAHVSGKDELLQLLIDRVAGEIEVPEPDPARWQEQVKEFAREMRRVLAAHRDLAGASLANIPTGPHAMRAIDGLLGILRAGGLPDQVVAYASDLLPQLVTVDVYEGSLWQQRIDREPDYFERFRAYLDALPAARFPNIAVLTGALVAQDEAHDARFEFGLDVLVRGLASHAKPRARQAD